MHIDDVHYYTTQSTLTHLVTESAYEFIFSMNFKALLLFAHCS